MRATKAKPTARPTSETPGRLPRVNSKTKSVATAMRMGSATGTSPTRPADATRPAFDRTSTGAHAPRRPSTCRRGHVPPGHLHEAEALRVGGDALEDLLLVALVERGGGAHGDDGDGEHERDADDDEDPDLQARRAARERAHAVPRAAQEHRAVGDAHPARVVLGEAAHDEAPRLGDAQPQAREGPVGHEHEGEDAGEDEPAQGEPRERAAVLLGDEEDTGRGEEREARREAHGLPRLAQAAGDEV